MLESKSIRILITGSSSTNSVDFVRALARQSEFQFHLTAADIFDQKMSVGAQFCQDYVKVPKATDPNFTIEIQRICREKKIDILVPMIDEEFLALASIAGKLRSESTVVMLPKLEILETCLHKIKFNLFLAENGFPHLPIFKSRHDISELPVISKPELGRGSQGVKVLKSPQDLSAHQLLSGFFYQKMVSGEEYTVDLLCSSTGKALVAIPRIRLEVRDGKSVKAKTVRNEVVERTAMEICDGLQMTGPCCLQCIVDASGTPYFFDFNPRIGAATTISVQAGVNIPFLAIKNILGRPILPDELQFQSDLIMLRYWSEVFTK